ncbi:MAG: DUF3427 domain-containing protein [Alloprevotella sp.]|nr:DUF3427 domain-containing protein [Alloprevotella sp.]MBR1428336.1 DUF3427 domain-containing protein [Prevotella sp.]
MKLVEGVYESLISTAIAEKLKQHFPESRYHVEKETIDSAESHTMLAQYLAEIVSVVLKEYFHDKKEATTISNQVTCVNKILHFIENEWNVTALENNMLTKEDETRFLRAIYSKTGYTDEQIKHKAHIHPESGYRVSNLFTGTNGLSIDEEIKKDIQTADSIDLVVSFIKFTGLRILYDELKKFVSKKDTKLRILTTTYMGATDVKAVKTLMDLKELGDVEIKASFNTNDERLHAKAYIFKRENGFDTAYIGSSNISRSALTKGLEWNLRVTNIENPHIIRSTQATFDSYWNSAAFEPIETIDDLQRFSQSIDEARNRTSNIDGPEIITRFVRKTHQVKVLEKLQYEREQRNNYKNLIIAATGTGKTAISAFDFKDFNKKFKKENGREARLLFVVHREKILKQARSTYRSVMVDGNFGEIWTGNIKPSSNSNLDHLFITIQTLNNHIDELRDFGEDYYDYIVLDEVHHSQADSYRKLFSVFRPKILIGLTATPERMDGKAITPDFNDRFSAEIRLQEALNQQLLSPFAYFCVTDDTVDLSLLAISADGKYDIKQLESKYVGNVERFGKIQDAINRYLTDPKGCKAVCFCCSIAHAEWMATMFNNNGYRAASVTSKNSSELDNYSEQLVQGKINYLCVADILNEGIDIPEIDTVFFLRPTESLTVFLQQLGRGLRLADGKTELTVLDFVAQANNKYNYESRFRALIGPSNTTVKQQVENGFTLLPRGCSINMELQAQQYILNNISRCIFNLRRLRREVEHFEHETGQALTLRNFIENFSIDWRLIYKTAGSWTELKNQAGINVNGYNRTAEVINIERGLTRLFHTNSTDYLSFINKLIEKDFQLFVTNKREAIFKKQFYYTICYDKLSVYNTKYGHNFTSEEDAIIALNNFPYLKQELQTCVELRLSQLYQTTRWVSVGDTDIELYGCYSADEIHVMFEGDIRRGNILGTQYLQEQKIALVFVSTNKSDKDYSPSTLYQDYAISEHQFHWQSKHDVRIQSNDGQRIIHQQENGWKFLLFVRDRKRDEFGLTNAYFFLGEMEYNDSHGECPINVIWNMKNNIPGNILELTMAI